MEVKMLKKTFFKGMKLAEGDIVDVEEDIAERWRRNKVAATKKSASKGSNKKTTTEKQQEVEVVENANVPEVSEQ